MKTWQKVLIAFLLTSSCLFLLGAWYLISCVSNGYEVRDGKVFYRWFNNAKWKIERRELEGADPQQLKTVPRSGGTYAQDGQQVYFHETSITNANPDSFQILDWREEFSRDDQRAYWRSSRISDDPNNFQVLTRGYAKDKKHVYYASRVVRDADPDTFVVDGTATSHAHDANNRYNMGRKVED